MVLNDIYDSQTRYEQYKDKVESFLIPPKIDRERRGARKYYCKSKSNLKYFYRLFEIFEARDTSYVRRNRLLNTFLLICHATEKDLGEFDRSDTDAVVKFMHSVYMSPKSKTDFIRDMKFMWKLLFPETDERGRIDDTICPYPVRHLSARTDKSREKRRKDKLTLVEIESLLQYFSNDPCVQAFIALSLDALGRPQETCYTKISDVEIYDNYARVWISEHGKEGTGFLQCIDSYPYLIKWYNQHPFRDNPDTFLFLNKDKQQLTPAAINKRLRKACKDLGIEKPITSYSLKRNGVTIKRHLGYSDLEIQYTARWTSTKQLQIYDLSDQDDAFKIQLVKRGLIIDEKYKGLKPQTRECVYCKKLNGMTDKICTNCQRPLERIELRKVVPSDDQEKNLKLVQLFKELLEENPELVEGMARKVGLLS